VYILTSITICYTPVTTPIPVERSLQNQSPTIHHFFPFQKKIKILNQYSYQEGCDPTYPIISRLEIISNLNPPHMPHKNLRLLPATLLALCEPLILSL